MGYSTLLQIGSDNLNSEAEVETRLLLPLFRDLGYPQNSVIPKKSIKPLLVNDGSKRFRVEVDFILNDKKENAFIVVEAKDPKEDITSAWGQAASYALSYNRDKEKNEKIKYLLLSNGHITGLYRVDNDNPIITLQLSDIASGSPPYVKLRSEIKFDRHPEQIFEGLTFKVISPEKLNKLFAETHDLVWKKEKLNPTDAFFEFCKFIFLKIREDKKREDAPKDTPTYKLPLTIEWLEAQETTTKHPVRDVLFINLRNDLEAAIRNNNKKRIFEPSESLKLSASTCRELIKKFQTINLSSIDEDLNGRMFEVFLNAAVRGKALGQYFTPRSVVDFMTRIALSEYNPEDEPKIIDACAGTAGFLIETMAYLLSRLRNDTRFTNEQRKRISENICNECLYGIEGNDRVSRIARINMYLHGDGGSHIFHGDGLDNSPFIEDDMSDERKSEVREHKQKIIPEFFDIALSNPPFSMSYSSKNSDEKRILGQRDLVDSKNTAKSNILFLDRYHELLKKGGELLIVIDDTILNGFTNQYVRDWLLDKFVVLGVHSLPFNAFFKAKANIKTSIIHLRKKANKNEEQGHVFMSITNNIGHDNSLKDTPDRNNLNNVLVSYLEWKRTGNIDPYIKENHDKNENLECPEQVWLLPPDELISERLDSFYYSPALIKERNELNRLEEQGEIELIKGRDLKLANKLTAKEKRKLKNSDKLFKYIEISDVTKYGLITTYIKGRFEELPTRGEYIIRENDILVAINNSSRGTVVITPKAFDGAICTSGFLVIRPDDYEEARLLWYTLRSESCRKQIYYLAQTASQPELKLDSWNNEFIIPLPNGKNKEIALKETDEFLNHLRVLLDADKFRFNY
jgi:type I restriction enzyme M protein